MTIDLSLTNTELYEGCILEQVGGRLNLATSPENAIPIIGANLSRMLEKYPPGPERDVVTLTGPMAVWAYLIVFHRVVHAFRKVYYNDGKSPQPLLIAAHG